MNSYLPAILFLIAGLLQTIMLVPDQPFFMISAIFFFAASACFFSAKRYENNS